MQVISGKYRARKLKSPDSARPTLQRIKISTFSLIQDFIKPNIEVLDVFAGSGALGIECLSRGAKYACFIDKDLEAVKCIKSNLKGIDPQYFDVFNSDFKQVLKQLSEKGKRFDVVFVDPPYEDGFYAPTVDIINRYKLLSDDGIIVLEMNKNKPYKIDEKSYMVYKERDYGITKIIVLQKLISNK